MPQAADTHAQTRRRIMDAALEVFLRDGYVGAKTDEIASAAGASKQTIYKHFGPKESLFEQIVLDRLVGIDQIFRNAMVDLAATDDVETTLRAVARQFVHALTQPSHLRVRRLVIAEAGRFPNLGHAYFEAGPERVHAALASCFEQLTGRGLLRIDDPVLAANHFTWLVSSIPVNKVMLCGDDIRFAPSELDHYADAAVRVFLAAYRTPGADAQ
ncbi:MULTISPECIES: TetR/AcrR family transcriptional regulator [unclassified Nonomuraea]|uniref:TetR/AcrR family transcriptional regulator n=1 Tax=unclassified Nonomuraea TaxID=2593643 RepID=UPI00340D981E